MDKKISPNILFVDCHLCVDCGCQRFSSASLIRLDHEQLKVACAYHLVSILAALFG
jgi:hypothetical protein